MKDSVSPKYHAMTESKKGDRKGYLLIEIIWFEIEGGRQVQNNKKPSKSYNLGGFGSISMKICDLGGNRTRI
jgi:hypothetical protein